MSKEDIAFRKLSMLTKAVTEANKSEMPSNVSVGENSDGNVAIGSHNSVGNVTTHAGGDTAVLQERVKMLEKLLDEKEKLIKVLMEK